MSIYLDRYAWKEVLFPLYTPDPELKMVVVIPCYNETNIEKALNSLNNCSSNFKFLVLVVINESEQEDPLVSDTNHGTAKRLENIDLNYELLITHLKLPIKDAGVGLARKIGMDESVRFFEQINKDGIIVCFDADCTCDPNYLQTIDESYIDSSTEAGIVFYEHDLSENTETIIDYELHLRYYVDALRWAGFPNAYQTLGSCISVKSKRYQKEGGMNKRKAGEDFYFLHKLIPNKKFGEINTTTVYPSARISDRVPFGTGHAIAKNLDREEFLTYNPAIFDELKLFIGQLGRLFRNETTHFSKELRVHLNSIHFFDQLEKFERISNNIKDFESRFFRWFDGFMILKLVHFLRDNKYPNVVVSDAILWLSDNRIIQASKSLSKKEALDYLRRFDRSRGDGN